MKKDDLTQVKYVGNSRLKSLNEAGIRTIAQLHAVPLDKLAAIKTIGRHYAALIKDAAAAIYAEKPVKTAAKGSSVEEKKAGKLDRSLRKQIKTLNRRLKQANEDLKPLDKKKYQSLYIDFKTKANKLKNRLKALDQNQKNFTPKFVEKMTRRAAALNAALKTVGKSPKKKKYQKISKQVQAFSKKLGDFGS